MKHVIVVFLFSLCMKASAPKKNEIPKENALQLSKENVVKLMKEMEIQHVDVVLAQAILESGNFKSVLFKDKNNMFGMKVPSKRETTALNRKKGYYGYAKYESWVDCLRDYKLYQDYVTKKKNVSKSQYLSIIARSYSETYDYVSKLSKIMDQNKKYT